MWKYSSILFLFIAISFSSISQEANQEGFTLGLRGGIVATQVAGDGWGGFDKFGFFGGANIERKVSQNKGFEIGLQFIQKGSVRNSNPDKGDFLSYKLALSMVEMPVLFKFYQEPFIYDVGLAAEFLINTKEIDTDGIELDTRDQFNDISIGFHMGLEYELADKSFLNLRFTNSLSPIRNSVAVETGQVNFWRRIFNNGQYSTLIEFGFKRLIGQ